jgi:MerR family transcriptional regulator/heat shock protein HspR
VERGATVVTDAGRPLYRISVVADMLGVHPQTLRLYERKGLIRPSRTVGRTRMYSPEDVEDVRRILRLSRDLGVNLAGVEIILKMRRQMLAMQGELEDLATPARRDVAREAGSPEQGALVRVAERRLRTLDVF